MRLSNYLLPVQRQDASEAQIVSHKLMLRAGFVRQSAAGIYIWLPLGLRVLHKISQIVREEQDRIGAIELLMPTIQPSDIWRESGRYDAYGPEMLRFRDRGGRELLYGPTNEEMITALFRDCTNSYRDLPRILYHIQWKFRDEIRPRFGVMRGREFLMKDAYSFDPDEASARRNYNRMFVAYLKTFARMGLRAIPMRADTGPIGGSLSHEFIVLAPSGESDVYYDQKWEEKEIEQLSKLINGDDIDAFVQNCVDDYAATDEKRDLDREAMIGIGLKQSRGIEVGHIFLFGTKYSEPMGLRVQGKDGAAMFPHMGSYGIGVSRLIAAAIEANNDENGIVWPESIAPFKVGLINIRANNQESTTAAETLYTALSSAGVEVLYDDRDESGGAKFATMDLIGLPWQIIIGPNSVKRGVVEIKHRATGNREELDMASAIARFSAGSGNH